ncbi:Internalin A [subsurface metagenome]
MSGVVLAQGEIDTNATVKLKLIGHKGDIEIIEVDRNSERIALSKKKAVRIEGLEELPQLTDLSLQSFFINSLNWIPRNIKRLNLRYNKIQSLDGIEEFTMLEEFRVFGNKINEIDSIFKSNSIRVANLGGNVIEIVNCSDNESIERLDFSNNNIKHIYNLHKLKKLKTLILYANPIETNIEGLNKLRDENPEVEIKVRDKREE